MNKSIKFEEILAMKEAKTESKDPICGMTLDKATAILIGLAAAAGSGGDGLNWCRPGARAAVVGGATRTDTTRSRMKW
jgi:hypothetical protein